MKLLLDTCTFIWIGGGADKLSRLAREVYLDPVNECYLSAASAWEITIKYALGKLPLPGRPEEYIPFLREKSGFDSLPVDEESALHTSRLPNLHADPFDRILVAQAIVHGMVILTPDPAITQYPARILW